MAIILKRLAEGNIAGIYGVGERILSEFVMIMKGRNLGTNASAGWESYIEILIGTGKFRGGSAFGNGRCLSLGSSVAECLATGFMRFEADSIEEIETLVEENPVYKAGGEVEIHELVVD